MTERRSYLRQAADAALVTLFMAALFAPLADTFIGLDPTPPLSEKRILAAMPAAPGNWEEIKAWPRRFEDWYNDHFGFRSPLVRGYAAIKYFVLHTSPTDIPKDDRLPPVALQEGTVRMYPRVVVGRGPWLFFGEDLTIEDYRGLRAWQLSDLLGWQKGIEERRDFCRERGIAYLYAIAPNKQSIYPEALPGYVTKVNPRTKLDRLAQHFDGLIYDPLPFLDLRGPLLEATQSERVYHHHDAHWNDAGCVVAYNEIMTSLTAQRPSLRAVPEDTVNRTKFQRRGGDVAEMAGLEWFLWEEAPGVTVIPPSEIRIGRARKAIKGVPRPLVTECDDAPNGTAVIFRDSFTTPLIKFFSATFKRVVYCRFEHFKGALIESENPEVVIEIVAERGAANYYPFNFDEVSTTGTASWSSGQEEMEPAFQERVRRSSERARLARERKE